MKDLFLQVLDMSISSSWLILAVIGIRFLMQKIRAPKNLCYLLWLFVGIRLLCPFTIESTMSLLPRQDVLPEALQVSKEERVDKPIDVKVEEEIEQEHIYGIENIILNVNDENVSSGENLVENQLNGETIQSQISDIDFTENMQIDITGIFSVIWGIGTLGFLGYGIVSYVKLSKKVSASVYTDHNVWICDEIHSPFLLGLRKPRIYIPSDIEESRIPYIVAHEKEHMRCLDYLWKPLGFFLLAVHWFNPFVWMAYVLMCKDIEYACDERVIRDMDNVQKKMYTESLLLCSSPRHYITVCPVAFGETSIKERIKNVVTYKKPALWIVGLGIVACVVVAICFMTSPPENETDQNGTELNENNTIVGDESYISENGVEGIPGDAENDETTYIASVENKVIFETTADLNHDGIEDLVQTVLVYNPQEEASGDDVTHPANAVFIRIYQGSSEGVYYRDAGVSTDIVSMSHAVNGTYVLTEKDGLDYLIFSNMYQMQGEAGYQYKVFYLNENGSEKIVTSDLVNFKCDPFGPRWEEGPYREDVIPEFRKGLEKWLSDTSMILVSFDAMEEPYYTTGDCLIPASLYYEKVWARNEEEALEEYYAIYGEGWQKYIYSHNFHQYDDIYWIKEQLESDFFEWYTQYNGSKLQRVVSADPEQAHYGPSVNLDIIYYQADANEDVQDVLYKMFEAMLVARMESEEGRPYTITDYVVGDTPVVQISEHMWLVEYLSGYYKYEGTDLITYEEALGSYEEEHIIDGCVPIMMQGSDDNFWYLLMEKDGVYRLQRYHDMMKETE